MTFTSSSFYLFIFNILARSLLDRDLLSFIPLDPPGIKCIVAHACCCGIARALLFLFPRCFVYPSSLRPSPFQCSCLSSFSYSFVLSALLSVSVPVYFSLLLIFFLARLTLCTVLVTYWPYTLYAWEMKQICITCGHVYASYVYTYIFYSLS